MRGIKWLGMTAILVLLLSTGVLAQTQTIPVDIPGTGVHFFLLRYEGSEPPFTRVQAIWERLNEVFLNWVASGQDPKDLTPDDVTVRKNESGIPSIYLKDTLIVEVDRYHAEANWATQEQLAEMWAANLRQGVKKFVDLNQPKR